MKQRMQNRMAIGLVAVVSLSLTLLSFSMIPGGDHFEVYLNKKLLFQQAVVHSSSLKTLALDQRNINDQVDVYYSHCGKIGTKRMIIIKDGKNVVKQWRFAEASGNKFMSIAAKEFLAHQNKNGDRKLSLYYSSHELPEGRLLTSIILDTDNNKATP